MSLPPWLLRPLQHHPSRELVVHAAALFGDLQSFMRQELDQAVATQALWHALSGRQRVSLRPEGRSGDCWVTRAACCTLRASVSPPGSRGVAEPGG